MRIQAQIVALVSLVLCGCAQSYRAPYAAPTTIYASDILMPAEPPSVSHSERVQALSASIDPERRAYYYCVQKATIDYITANENASTVVTAAMTRCRSEELDLQRAINVHNRTAINENEIMGIHRKTLSENAVELVIRFRESSKRLDRYRTDWSECLVLTVGNAATNDNETKRVVATAFSACAREEQGMRAAWTSMINADYADRRMNEGKTRALPILVVYVENIRKGQTAKKPDMQI